jgi:hypothetical protein
MEIVISLLIVWFLIGFLAFLFLTLLLHAGKQKRKSTVPKRPLLKRVTNLK